MASFRSEPNIIITGTPGVGKSSIAKRVADNSELTWYDISKIAVEKGMVEEYDEAYSCPVIDESRVRKFIKPKLRQGGCILDFYSATLFPAKWIDIVFVIQTKNKILFDRLVERGYKKLKLQQNMDYEIHGIALEDSREAFDPDIVYPIENNNNEQLEDTVNRICSWIEQWKIDNK